MNNNIGVNVLGYFRYQFGVAQLANLIVSCLESSKVPYIINDIDVQSSNKIKITNLNISNTNNYPINIIVVNSFEIPEILKQNGIEYFKDKYNIGVWCWETEYFSKFSKDTIKYFNEIWTI